MDGKAVISWVVLDEDSAGFMMWARGCWVRLCSVYVHSRPGMKQEAERRVGLEAVPFLLVLA